MDDWNRERYDFGTRAELIAAVEAVSLEDLRGYYRETVLSDSPSRILDTGAWRALAGGSLRFDRGCNCGDERGGFSRDDANAAVELNRA